MAKWIWWEVQVDDRRGQPITGDVGVYTASVESIEVEDVDTNKDGVPVETIQFVESSAFFVVKTLADGEPWNALKRAILLMLPSVMSEKKDVQCYPYPHET